MIRKTPIVIALFVLALAVGCGEKSGSGEGEGTDSTAQDSTAETASNTGDIEASMKSGHVTIYTPDLDGTQALYEAVGFEVVESSEKPRHRTMADGSLVIVMKEDAEARMSLDYMYDDLGPQAKGLEESGFELEDKLEVGGEVVMFSLTSPEGIKINYVKREMPGRWPATIHMADLTMDQLMGSWENVNPKMGMFGEYSVITEDLKASTEWWSKIGLQSKGDMGGYAIVTDGIHIVGLHTGEDWEGQHITYFGQGQAKNIEAMKAAGLEGLNEMESFPGNAMLDVPGSESLFVFNWGM